MSISRKTEAKRVNPSKKLRFEVFKRDGFTCQYCGCQPPSVVLVCDHIDPVALGGKTSIENLITACESCNQGKGARPLTTKHVRPDADLLLLEVQQELVELKRFQQAEQERDALIDEIAEDLQQRWMQVADTDYPPSKSIFSQMLRKYSPEVVHEAVLVTAKKEYDCQFRKPDDAIPYLWGVAKRISARTEIQEG